MRILITFLLSVSALFGANVMSRNGFTVIPAIGGTAGSTINGRASVSEINGLTLVMNSKTTTWSNNIAARFSASRPNTRSTWIANNFAYAFDAASFSSKIIYVLPLLGQDMIAALEPIVDTLTVGYADGGAFGNGDFSESTGLQGDGATKVLNSRIKPSQLGTSNSGGIGYWENNIDFTGNTAYLMTGCTNTAGTNYYVTGGGPGDNALLYWGNPANLPSHSAVAATNGHFYGQRSSSTLREVYKNGSLIGNNTTSDATSGANEQNIAFVGCKGSSYLYFKGRAACCYLTDGTMSSGDVSAFHTLLLDYLFTPTGRPSS